MIQPDGSLIVQAQHDTPSVGLIVDDYLQENAGIPRYSAQLYAGLCERWTDVRLLQTRGPQIPYGEAYNHVFRLPAHILLSTRRLDLLHATSPVTALSFPLVNRRKVVTFHDCYSILSRGIGVTAHANLFLPLIYRSVAAHSDRVIAHSAQTKAELVKHLRVPGNKITVVNSGIDPRFRALPGDRSRRHYTLGYVGTLLSPRKRLDYLISAFGTLRREHPRLLGKLVLCGENGDRAVALRQLAEDLDVLQDVEFAGPVPDERLVEMYNSFDVYVLASDWEGFGFTILEAQRCGVPVVVRDDAQIPTEVSACCVKAVSERDMADKIHELLTDDSLRRALVSRGLEYSQQFTWDRTVHQTVAVYEQLLS